MKQRSIVFTSLEVVATLRRDKTQMRLAIKLPHHNPLGEWEPTTIGGPNGGRTASGETVPVQGAIWHTRTGDSLICPLGQPGDRLWAREAFRFTAEFDGDSPARVAERCLDAGYREPWAPIRYEADGTKRHWEFTGAPPGRLRSARHMPIWASRLSLHVVGIRIERLQSISEADARAEAAPLEEHHTRGYCAGESRQPSIRAFRDAWDREHAARGYAWDANPWVWVISFRLAASAAAGE
ncbi:hypothetical protein NFI99_23900 [Burkholderia glumae]|uniref:Uncharacterized protein n=1 Tax=Burkholderia glumae TaxID=337 RepID=A0ABY5BDE3_BURGL|nr:hypothetical protein [Burkholderia glumae]USS44674.1 hypothetical protein NFI99_23900 [Burkholderia glumae]